jgi:hypothetical protein
METGQRALAYRFARDPAECRPAQLTLLEGRPGGAARTPSTAQPGVPVGPGRTRRRRAAALGADAAGSNIPHQRASSRRCPGSATARAWLLSDLLDHLVAASRPDETFLARTGCPHWRQAREHSTRRPVSSRCSACFAHLAALPFRRGSGDRASYEEIVAAVGGHDRPQSQPQQPTVRRLGAEGRVPSTHREGGRGRVGVTACLGTSSAAASIARALEIVGAGEPVFPRSLLPRGDQPGSKQA